MNLYKPNANGTGHAIGLQFNSKDGALFAQFIKQTGWDANTKKGVFKNGKKFNLKFNASEIGVILNCIERGKAAKLFHQSEKGNTSIELKEYTSKKDGQRDGFTISVNPRDTEGEKGELFGFWFNAGEARLLKEYLQFALQHFFSAEYSAEKKRREEYYKKAEAGQGSRATSEHPADPLDDGF